MTRLDTTVAHPARIYDYWLGGKDNYAADRKAGDDITAVSEAHTSAIRGSVACRLRRFTTVALGA